MGKKSIPEIVKCQIVGLNKQENQSVTIAKSVGVSEDCISETLKSLKTLRLLKILQDLVGLQS